MKSYKVFIIIVTVLIIVNCGLLATFWFKQGGPIGLNGPPPPRQAVNAYLSKELSLTPAQEKLYEVLRNKHAEYAKDLNDESRALRDSLFENIKTPVLNTVATDALEKRIGDIQIKLDKATLEHFRKFRTILGVNQQVKFDKIIKNALHMMGGPPPRRGGRPGQGPPNGGPPGDGQGPPPGQGPPGQQQPPPDAGPPRN